MGEIKVYKCSPNLSFIVVGLEGSKDETVYIRTGLQTMQVVWIDAPQRRLLRKIVLLIESGIISTINDLSHHSRGHLGWATTYKRFDV